jgi:hypothetical protein
LLPARGAPASCAFPAFFPLDAALAGEAFLLALPCAGAPWATRAPAWAFFPALGLSGAASGLAATGSGATIWPSFSTRSQILLAAVLESFSDFTGFTPGKLLKACAVPAPENRGGSCTLTRGTYFLSFEALADFPVLKATRQPERYHVKVALQPTWGIGPLAGRTRLYDGRTQPNPGP